MIQQNDWLIVVTSSNTITFRQSCCYPVTTTICWQLYFVDLPMPNLLHYNQKLLVYPLRYNWSCCLERFYMGKQYVHWNSFGQSYEDEKEHTMHTVFDMSMWRVNQAIPYDVSQFSGLDHDPFGLIVIEENHWAFVKKLSTLLSILYVFRTALNSQIGLQSFGNKPDSYLNIILSIDALPTASIKC